RRAIGSKERSGLLTPVWVFAMARHLKTVSRKYAQKLIVVQMFNYFRQSCYCKYHVSGSLFYVK
ncbi:hypothetical protein, partial [Myroides odoratimimus]|uniref:hypothetical protein n=1 Tax=Myroides odoratimimus TaxID=76832 RepID=UPI00257507C4